MIKKTILLLLALSLTGCFETTGEDDGTQPILDPGGGVTYPPSDGDGDGDGDDNGGDDDGEKDENGLTPEEKQFDTATFDEARFT